MSFLHKLWDETLAGPMPESGLGKLRKYNSFNGRSVNSEALVDDHNLQISRSISIRHGNSAAAAASGGVPKIRIYRSGSGSGSIPSSPTGSSTPSSPRSPSTPGGNVKKFIKDKEPKGPTGYDWYLIYSSFLSSRNISGSGFSVLRIPDLPGFGDVAGSRPSIPFGGENTQKLGGRDPAMSPKAGEKPDSKSTL